MLTWLPGVSSLFLLLSSLSSFLEPLSSVFEESSFLGSSPFFVLVKMVLGLSSCRVSWFYTCVGEHSVRSIAHIHKACCSPAYLLAVSLGVFVIVISLEDALKHGQPWRQWGWYQQGGSNGAAAAAAACMLPYGGRAHETRCRTHAAPLWFSH